MEILVQVNGTNIKTVFIPREIKDQKLWLYTTLYKDIDVQAAVGKKLKNIVHVQNKLVNLITM